MSAGHPLAAGAAVAVLARGGNAADAAVAAHAALAVVLPDACGLGGDALALVRRPGAEVVAVNGTGCAPADPGWVAAADGAASITVPGAVGAWAVLAGFGRLTLGEVLAPAVRLAREGFALDAELAAARDAHRARLEAGGAGSWPVARAPVGELLRLPRLADALDAIGHEGAGAFYRGHVAAAVAAAARRHGGVLSEDDLSRHVTPSPAPLEVAWAGGRVHVQPPVSQGVLLARALAWFEQAGEPLPGDLDHLGVEVTEAVFALRDRAAEGAALLDVPLDVHPERAARRGGPRGYLHTTAVATADREGTVVSSLLSVFDPFGSGVYVPEGEFVLNNRAGSFTAGANDPAPGRRPVHTLAPALVEVGGGALALATPGADGQVQTLLQLLLRRRWCGQDLPEAVAAPRWRSESGTLLVESGHPSAAGLAAAGHQVVARPPGHPDFGAVVAAGVRGGVPYAVSDWRRQVWSAVL